MTGKTEADSIESLIEELKNAVRIESCDKEDDQPCLDVHFNSFSNSIDDKTPTAELQDESRIGYVLLDTTPPPNPISGSVTFSETQSISSYCDSHLCPSCESAGYESESSGSITKAHSKTLVNNINHSTLISARISALPKTLVPHSHHNDNFNITRKISHDHNDAGSSDHDYSAHPPFSNIRLKDRDTASESTSGISSQDNKTRFTSMTSDSETQTDGDPPRDCESESSGTTANGEPHREKFYLDRYTHLTKRRRSKGIPNVAHWFGMSAVEHLIQHSIDCNRWMWNEEPNTPENEVKIGHRVPDRVDLNKGQSKSEPVPLNKIKYHDQDSRYLQVMSDVGPCPEDKDSLSSNSRGSSPRASIHSLDSTNLKKKSNGWAQKLSNRRTSCTEKLPKVRKSCLKKKQNGVKSSKESLEEKRRNDTLTEILKVTEDLNDEDGGGEESKKKKKSSKGGGMRRGGGTMMKCAMFDEFVDYSSSKPEPEEEDIRRRRIDPNHGWREVFRAEMQTKAFQDNKFTEYVKDIEKDIEDMNDLKNDNHSFADKWKKVLQEKKIENNERDKPDKPVEYKRSSVPVKCKRQPVDSKEAVSNASKKWMKSAKNPGDNMKPLKGKPPPTRAQANWNKAGVKGKSLATLSSSGKGGLSTSVTTGVKPPSASSTAKNNWAKISIKSNSATTLNKPTSQNTALKSNSAPAMGRPGSSAGAKKPYVPYKPANKTTDKMGSGKMGDGKKGKMAPKIGGGKMGKFPF